MYVMINNKIIKTSRKGKRKIFLLDGSSCDITQIKYFWKKGKPQENPHYLNPEILREIFRKIQYEDIQ